MKKFFSIILLAAAAVSASSCVYIRINPGDFGKSLMDVVLYAPGRVNAIYKRLAGRDDIKTTASTFSGARILTIHVVNGDTDTLAIFEFISDDIMQCRLAINLPDTKPFIWTANPEPSLLITGLKTKGALVSAAVDAAYVQGKVKAEEEAHPRTAEEKKTKIKAGDGSIEIDEEDPSIEDIRNNVKAIFARITEGSRGSLDAAITLRCTTSAIRDEVFQTVDGFVTLYTMLSSASFEIGKDGNPRRSREIRREEQQEKQLEEENGQISRFPPEEERKIVYSKAFLYVFFRFCRFFDLKPEKNMLSYCNGDEK